MPSMYDSLATLLSGPQRANEPLTLEALRRKRRDEMFTGEAGAQHPEDLAALEADLAGDPSTGLAERKRVQDTYDLNQQITDYNRPDVTAMRVAEQAAKERLAGAPARAAGEANANAARIAAEAKYQALSEMLASGQGGRISVAGVGSIGPDVGASDAAKAAAALERTKLQQQGMAIRSRIAALQTGKANAVKSHFWEMQDTANQREIQNLMLQLNDLGNASPDSGDASGTISNPAPVQSPVTPGPRPRIRSVQQVG